MFSYARGVSFAMRAETTETTVGQPQRHSQIQELYAQFQVTPTSIQNLVLDSARTVYAVCSACSVSFVYSMHSVFSFHNVHRVTNVHRVFRVSVHSKYIVYGEYNVTVCALFQVYTLYTMYVARMINTEDTGASWNTLQTECTRHSAGGAPWDARAQRQMCREFVRRSRPRCRARQKRQITPRENMIVVGS